MSWFSMIPSKTVVSRRTSLRIIMKQRNDFSCVVGCLAVTKRVLLTTDSKLLFLNIYTFLKIIGKIVVSCHFDFLLYQTYLWQTETVAGITIAGHSDPKKQETLQFAEHLLLSNYLFSNKFSKENRLEQINTQFDLNEITLFLIIFFLIFYFLQKKIFNILRERP